MPEDPWYTAYNLYAEKKGRSHPDEIIVVLAHKDSQSWVDSPGANDNAIGTVSVLEMACILAQQAPDAPSAFFSATKNTSLGRARRAAENAKRAVTRLSPFSTPTAPA